MKIFNHFATLACLLICTIKLAVSLTEQELQEWWKSEDRGKFKGSSRKGKSSLLPRETLPKDWKLPKYLNSSMSCEKTYSVAKEGFIRFQLNSPGKDCSYDLLGSKAERCIVAVLCDGDESHSLGKPPVSGKCPSDYLKISDGTLGYLEACGSFFLGQPYISHNTGSDLYLTIKGTSDAVCVAFCSNDVKLEEIKKAKHLPEVALDKFTSEKCTCGVINNKGRVVNGEDAQKFEFPWLGAVVYHPGGRKGWERVSWCGASLVSDSYAVTAAHCMFINTHPLKPEHIQVIFHAHVMDKDPGLTPRQNANYSWTPGWNDPMETDESEGSVRVDVEEIYVHPFFEWEFGDYDIAVIKLKTKMNLKETKVGPLCLPFLNEKLEFKEGRDSFIAAGWGRPRQDVESLTRVLQKQEHPFISEKNCKGNDQTKRHLCAGFKTGDKGVCSGDSGGPLIYKIDQGKNQYVLAGVVSKAKACAMGNPALYTDTRETVQWIYRHMGRSSNIYCPR